jgi:hypothetical protein
VNSTEKVFSPIGGVTITAAQNRPVMTLTGTGARPEDVAEVLGSILKVLAQRFDFISRKSDPHILSMEEPSSEIDPGSFPAPPLTFSILCEACEKLTAFPDINQLHAHMAAREAIKSYALSGSRTEFIMDICIVAEACLKEQNVAVPAEFSIALAKELAATQVRAHRIDLTPRIISHIVKTCMEELETPLDCPSGLRPALEAKLAPALADATRRLTGRRA